MNLLSNSCQQTGKKSENGKKGPTHKPRYRTSAKIFLLLRYNLFIGVDKMRVKNITITVSVRVSATVRVSLVLFVSSNTFGASSADVVYIINLLHFTQGCVYNIGEFLNRNLRQIIVYFSNIIIYLISIHLFNLNLLLLLYFSFQLSQELIPIKC